MTNRSWLCSFPCLTLCSWDATVSPHLFLPPNVECIQVLPAPSSQKNVSFHGRSRQSNLHFPSPTQNSPPPYSHEFLILFRTKIVMQEVYILFLNIFENLKVLYSIDTNVFLLLGIWYSYLTKLRDYINRRRRTSAQELHITVNIWLNLNSYAFKWFLFRIWSFAVWIDFEFRVCLSMSPICCQRVMFHVMWDVYSC